MIKNCFKHTKLYIGPLKIENHVCEQLLKVHALDHINFPRHMVMVYTILVAYFLKLQIVVFYTRQPI